MLDRKTAEDEAQTEQEQTTAKGVGVYVNVSKGSSHLSRLQYCSSLLILRSSTLNISPLTLSFLESDIELRLPRKNLFGGCERETWYIECLLWK